MNTSAAGTACTRLYRRDRLHYVGLATNLRARLRQHLKDRHKGLWDRFSVYLTVGGHHIKELESLLLRIVKPKGNTMTGRFPKSQDLRRQLARDVRKRQRDELHVIIGKKQRLAKRRSAKARSKTRKSEPVLARYVTTRLPIRARYKGKTYRASVRRTGWIYRKGYLYRTPSAVAEEICKHKMNGWRFWQYERAPGDWVHLDTLKS